MWSSAPPVGWRASDPDGYHLEYGYSCMGYEIAGGLGVKMAKPDRRVFVLVGDGSYLMMNSEIATSVAMRLPIVIVVLDNHGFGCINRLQQACGGAPFNNLLVDSGASTSFAIDFVAHAKSLGASAEPAKTIADLESALARARSTARTSVIVIETDPSAATVAGGGRGGVAVAPAAGRPPGGGGRARRNGAPRR